MTLEDFISYLFYIRENMKIYHWTTGSYARHKASDSFLEELDKFTDSFVEVYMGKYGRPDFKQKRRTLKLGEWSDDEVSSKLNEFKMVLQKQLPEALQQMDDTDMTNLRDEILGQINKTLYLFSLN